MPCRPLTLSDKYDILGLKGGIVDISVRQLLREPQKYLRPGVLNISRYGKPWLVISIVLSDNKPVLSDKDPALCKTKDCQFEAYHKGYCMKHSS